MLRDAQMIGCADMPQRADMPLLPLDVIVITQSSNVTTVRVVTTPQWEFDQTRHMRC